MKLASSDEVPDWYQSDLSLSLWLTDVVSSAVSRRLVLERNEVFERRMFQTKLPALINLLRNSVRKENTHRELMTNNVSGDTGGHERERLEKMERERGVREM